MVVILKKTYSLIPDIPVPIGFYASNIDCPTITHEILHLYGLCDEYHEAEKWILYRFKNRRNKKFAKYENPKKYSFVFS